MTSRRAALHSAHPARQARGAGDAPISARTPRVRPAGARGVTLMELMITLAVVAVLAVIIIPAYTSNVQKSRRTDAKNALLDLAAREEKWYSTNNTYVATGTQLGYNSSTFPINILSSGTVSYTLSVTSTASTFTATAARTGPQSGDTCGDYTINEQGAQNNTGATQTSPPCW